MVTPVSHAPAGQERPTLVDFLDALRKMGQTKAPDGAPTYATGELRTELLKQILRASFAQDARGRRLREAWSLVGQGLTLLLREFSGQAPSAQDE